MTQKRLVHRAGVMAAIIFALVIGLSFLSGLVAFLAGTTDFIFASKQEAGKLFYGWVLGIEILVLPVAGLSRISNALSEDRKNGLWDSNRMTPLKPAQLVLGYWFGSPLREFYAGAALMLCGLAIVVLAGLPLTFWAGTQTLVLSTTLFFGILGVLTGLSAKQAGGGLLLLLAMIILIPISLVNSRMLLTGFLLPIYGMVSLFSAHSPNPNAWEHNQWLENPTFFGLNTPAIVFTLGLQAIVGAFIWRAVTRKTAQPFRPMLSRWQTAALFAVLMVAQHGLIWDAYAGRYPNYAMHGYYYDEAQTTLSIVQAGAILLGGLMLAFAGPAPEQLRLEALRTGQRTLRLVFSRSAVTLAFILVAVAAVTLATHFVFTPISSSWLIYLVAVLNLLSFYLIFSLWLEYCRLRFRQRAVGFGALGLFIVCILPYILAGIFSNAQIGWLSLLSPGVVAFSSPTETELSALLRAVLCQTGLAFVLSFFWVKEWQKFLAKTAAA